MNIDLSLSLIRKRQIVLLVLCFLCIFLLSNRQVFASEQNVTSKKLHRADFKVSGASCVACLRRIGKTFREQKGVLKADVSIFKPYWAIVIYDEKETNIKNLQEAVKAEKVSFLDVEDKTISELPILLLPKGLNKQINTNTKH